MYVHAADATHAFNRSLFVVVPFRCKAHRAACICICVCMYIHMYIYMYIYILYIYVHVYMYMCI